MEKMTELKEKLEAAETVDAINEVVSEIEAEKSRQAAIAEKSAILDSFKAAAPVEAKSEPEPRTLGEYAAKNLDLSAIRAGHAKSAGTGYGFKTYTDAQTSQQIITYDTNVVDTAMRDLEVRSLYGAERISGNALKYFILGAREDNSAPSPGSVDEGGAKPQMHIVETSATATLAKIAGWFYETDELLEDNAFLASALNARGLYELDARIEAYLLSTTLSASGINTDTYAYGSDIDPDTVFEAIMTIKTQSGLNADGIVMHPTDYQAIRLLKDGTGGTIGQYYGGGCFYGPYGNGNVNQQPGLWGLKTVITPNITQGTVLVGAFKQGASVITKQNEGARIEVVTGDHDDRIYNRVTVIVEERLALAVRRPKAFVKITEAASS